jgi:hypothetical protein
MILNFNLNYISEGVHSFRKVVQSEVLAEEYQWEGFLGLDPSVPMKLNSLTHIVITDTSI